MTRRDLLRSGAGFPAASARAQAPEPRFRASHAAGEAVSFYAGGRPLFTYRYAASRAKPYVHPFCAAGGTPLTIDGPADHIHHRGLMLAWSDVAGYDFWGEVNPAKHGRIVHQRFERPPSEAGLTAINHWTAEGRMLIEEYQRVRPLPLEAGPGVVALEWESTLRAAGGPLVLDASKHVYNGLGMRFVRAMDLGGVLNACGTRAIEQANGEEAAWCCYHGALGEGRRAAVAIMNHPSNPRHPAAFFVMNKPFGYLAAAPTFREPFRLAPDRPLKLRWAVVSLLGEPAPERLDGMFRTWSGS
jgi:hypothetical protein